MSPSAKYRRRLKPGEAQPVSVATHVWTITPLGTLWVGLVMLLLGALCGFVFQPLLASSSHATAIPNQPTASPQAVEATRLAPTQDNSPRGALMRGVVSQTRHFLGNENAPVTVIEFCDFDVPECAEFANQVLAKVQANYINTGKVRFGFWPMSTSGASSQLVAEAAECAADQDAFWQYSAVIYTEEAQSVPDFDKNGLNAFAAALGLDTATFAECLDSGKYTGLIKDGTTTIQDLGLPEVPTFLVNGQPLVGLQTFESLQQTIDALISSQ